MTNKEQYNSRYNYAPEDVFNTYYGALCYYVSRIVQRDEAIKDIVQDVFTALLERKPHFDSENHLNNYLYLSAKNGSLNYLRKIMSHERYLEIQKSCGNADDDELIAQTEAYRLIGQAIKGLPPECRKVFQLAYVDGLDNDSVAHTLGLSVNTVKAQKARGKKILRERLKGDFLQLIVGFISFSGGFM